MLYPVLGCVNKNYGKETYVDVCKIPFKHEAQNNNALCVISVHFDVHRITFKS